MENGLGNPRLFSEVRYRHPTQTTATLTTSRIGTSRKPHESNSGQLIQAHLKISGEAIEQIKSVKYLEVALDNQMKWKDDIGHISSKVSRAIGMIKCAKKVLPTNSLKMIYLGLVEPHFRYCSSVWGSCGVNTRKTLDKLQNRAIRIITNNAYDVSVGPLLRQLKLPICYFGFDHARIRKHSLQGA